MNRPQHRYRRSLSALAVLFSLSLFCSAQDAGGSACNPYEDENDFPSNWNSRYPSSPSMSNAAASGGDTCFLCHESPFGGNTFNAYGWELYQEMDNGASINQALANVESGNVEGDPCGSTNLDEIMAGTQPGWTPGPNNTHYKKNGSTTTGQTAPSTIAGFLDPCFPTVISNGTGANPVILSDTGGSPTLSPRINDPTEPFLADLDCSGAGTASLYGVQIKTVTLTTPLPTSFGELLCGGAQLQLFLGPHTQNTVTVGPLVVPNDPSLFGLPYCVQGFCGDPSSKGFLSNALTQRIGF